MRENKARWTFAASGAVALAVVAGLVFQTTPAGAQTVQAGTRVTTRWTGSVDVFDRAAVNNAYQTKYAAYQNTPVNWLGGSLLGCLIGLTSSGTNAATLSSLNFVRSLAGLAPVRFNSTLNYQAQQSALMMAANNTLSHYPTSSWSCYTKTGAQTASKSNLALSYPTIKAGQVIDLYMDDRGTSNKAVGHRRWILNPFTTQMGAGTTDTANALVVIGPSSGSQPNPRYVTWPTRGYFPAPLEPHRRWSVSSGLSNVTFADARVRVFHNGNRLKVRKFPVESGYAQPTLVWQMPRFAKRGTYRVVVTRIHAVGSTHNRKMTYRVKFFHPWS